MRPVGIIATEAIASTNRYSKPWPGRWPDMSHHSTNGSRSGGQDGQMWLTGRESEVADLIARGLTNEQIAVQLVVTPGTVANHVAHILAKLRLTSRVQIAVKVTNEKTRSDTGTILRLLESLRQLESTTVREAMQRAAD